MITSKQRQTITEACIIAMYGEGVEPPHFSRAMDIEAFKNRAKAYYLARDKGEEVDMTQANSFHARVNALIAVIIDATN